MEFQLSYFKSWKMMLWKCCTQYASKSGKLSSGHRTGKGQFSSHFADKVCIVRAVVFLVVMYGCESWTIKKAECQRIDAFELCCWRRLLRVPWTAKEIKPVNLKGNQPWIFIGRTDAEAEAPILWLRDMNCQLPGKDPDAGKDWGQEEKGVTENEIVGWRHWLNGHEFEQTVGDSAGQGSLVCCSPWGHKEWDTTEGSN